MRSADRDEAVLTHDTRGQLVQEILPAVGDLRVERPGLAFLVRPLGRRQRRLQVAAEAVRLDVFQGFVRECGKVFQPKIDAQFFRSDLTSLDRHIACDVDVPAAPRIL